MISFKVFPRVVPLWFRRGSGVVQAWFRCGSGVDRNINCRHHVSHPLLKGGPIVVHAWFRYGSGVVQAHVNLGSERRVQPSCRARIFRGGPLAVQAWFRRGSGAVQAWIRRGSAAHRPVLHMQPSRAARVMQWLIKRGSCVVQARFRSGSRATWKSPLIMAALPRSARGWFEHGSGAAQARLGRCSGAVQVRSEAVARNERPSGASSTRG